MNKKNYKKIAYSTAVVAAVGTAAAVYYGATTNTVPEVRVPSFGVNLAGAEFSEGRGTYNTSYTYPTTAEVDYYHGKGVRFFRIPFNWENIQPTLGGPLSTAELSRLKTLVSYITSKGDTCLIDVHNYARYDGAVITTTGPVTPAKLADLWTKLANEFKSDPLVQFGIMNEPHTMPQATWAAANQAAIDAVRATGATNQVTMTGTMWSGVEDWVSNNAAIKGIKDPGDNSNIEVHLYLDADGSGGGGKTDCVSTTIGVERLTPFTTWARANGRKATLGEIGVITTDKCLTAFKNVLNHMATNSDVWKYGAYWAGGPWWGTSIDMIIEPRNGVDRPQMTVISEFMNSTATVDSGADSSATTCTSFTYSAWSTCQVDGKQTRTVLTSSPTGCTGGSPVTTQSCVYVPPVVSDTEPTNPISFTKGQSFTVNSGTTNYVYVPQSYDSTHKTPTKLFVWLHGCGGRSQYDVDMVSPGGSQQDWISLAPGGREGACWSGVSTDGPKILAAIASLKTQFNIDKYRVFLGGYSSGGDIGYPLAFQNANLFAGVLFENTGPNSAAMTAAPAAAWKLNIAHLAHTSDTTYPIATIRDKMNTLKGYGFPVNFIERAGTHWDNDTSTSGTVYDLKKYLLPFLSAGWVSPGGAPQPPSQCTYSYSSWSTCQSNGTQTRAVLSSSPSGCVGTPVTTQACTYTPTTCTTFTYTSWSACDSTGKQTRTVLTSSPTGCTGGSPVTQQSCTYNPPTTDTDGDGIPDTLDKCPTVKGVASTVASRYGCPARFTVSNKVTSDWGTGYCVDYYLKNDTVVPITWKSITLNLKDGKIRGPSAVWGITLSNYYATGYVTGLPVSWNVPVPPGKSAVLGMCVDYGPLKSRLSVSTIAY